MQVVKYVLRHHTYMYKPRVAVRVLLYLNGGLDGLHFDGVRLPHAQVLHVHQLAALTVDAPRRVSCRRVLRLQQASDTCMTCILQRRTTRTARTIIEGVTSLRDEQTKTP